MNRFKEEPFGFYPEFELDEAADFDPENFESEIADSEWEEEIEKGQPPAAGVQSNKAVRRCPPFQLRCDCAFLLLECGRRRKELCDRILGAITLAKRAASELEANPSALVGNDPLLLTRNDPPTFRLSTN